jgi:hypothetical protein
MSLIEKKLFLRGNRETAMLLTSLKFSLYRMRNLFEIKLNFFNAEETFEFHKKDNLGTNLSYRIFMMRTFMNFVTSTDVPIKSYMITT